MPLPLRIALLLLLLLAPAAHARQLIRGTVQNAQTGDPLFPATVQVEGTFQATITNPGGEYELNLDALPATVVISHIGYATARIRIDENAPYRQDVLLQPVAYELDPLVVTAQDLGPDIMRKVIERKQAWRSQLSTFSVEAYTRFTHKNDAGIVAVIESMSEAFWHRERGWREVVKSKRQTANLRLKDYLPAALFVTNLYDDNIEISGHTLIGVTHPEALDVYDFELKGYRFLDDKTVYDISVKPKNYRASAFNGTVSVLDEEYALIEADLSPNRQAFLFPPPIRAYRTDYRQQFRSFGPGFWLPVGLQRTAELDIGMVGLSVPTVKTDQISRLTNYRVNVPLPDSLYRNARLLSVDSVAVENDSLLARGAAVVPLSPNEETAYETIDSTLTLYNAFKPSGFLARFIEDPAENRKKPGSDISFKARPQIWYNRVDAAHLGLRLKLRSRKKHLTLGATSAYNTGIGRWSYDLSLGWGQKDRGLLELTYLKGSDTRYKSDLYSRFDTSFQPLFGGDDYFDHFWNERLNARLGYRLPNTKLSVTTGLNLERHTSLSKSTDYALFGIEHAQRPNPAITPGDLRSIAFNLVYQAGTMPPKAPPEIFGRKKIALTIERSHPGLFSSDFTFIRYRLAVDWRFKTFFRRRFLPNVLDLRAVAVTFTGVLPLQRFGHLDASLDGFNKFGTFRSIMFNPYEGERYAALFWEHSFRTLPFELLGLRALVDRGIGLIVHGAHGRTWISTSRLAALTYTPRYQDRFHHELGFSINGLLSLFRLDLTWRLDAPGFFAGIGYARLF